MTYKTYLHNPPHLFLKNSKYFISARTYKKIHFFDTDEAKEILVDKIISEFPKYNWEIEDWVVLDNHYHLMADSNDNPDNLSRIIQNIHRSTSIEIKKANALAKQEGKIWYNYWDTCIIFERSYWPRLNYIWFNPVKHGYVDDPKDWKFGSYYYRYDKEADELKEITRKFPCDKLDFEELWRK